MLKKMCCVLLAAAMFMSCAALANAEQTVSYDIIYTSANPVPDIAERVRPSVVSVTGYCETWDAETRIASEEEIGSGSGSFFLADETGGYVLTNYHVVSDGEIFRIEWLSGEIMDAVLAGHDDGTDIAVLHFEEPAPEGALPIPMGDSDALRIGELAICIGNPGSADEVLFGTVTAGIISGLEREDINANNFSRSISVIQTDAAINTGNSGGALLNAKGELVGIPTLKFMFSSSTVFEGLGFCIPINSVRDFISQIIETGRVSRPRLGITIADIEVPTSPCASIRRWACRFIPSRRTAPPPIPACRWATSSLRSTACVWRTTRCCSRSWTSTKPATRLSFGSIATMTPTAISPAIMRSC